MNSLDSSLAKIRLEINDAGVIHWQSNSSQYFIDTNIVGFRGANINALITDSTYNVLDTNNAIFNAGTFHNSFISYLPAYFSMSLNKQIDRHTFETGITHRAVANYRPYVYFQDEYNISARLNVFARLAYGAYGKLSGGIGLAYITPQWQVTLNTNHLEGLILPKLGTGYHFRMGLAKQF